MKLSNSTTESPLSLHFRRFVALITLPAFRLWGAAGTQYIPLKNMKSATGFFSDSDFLFSLCFIHIFDGTPWQFIFFFGTHCVLSGFADLRVRNLVTTAITALKIASTGHGLYSTNIFDDARMASFWLSTRI